MGRRPKERGEWSKITRTVYIPLVLWREAREVAKKEGTHFSGLVTEALLLYLSFYGDKEGRELLEKVRAQAREIEKVSSGG